MVIVDERRVLGRSWTFGVFWRSERVLCQVLITIDPVKVPGVSQRKQFPTDCFLRFVIWIFQIEIREQLRNFATWGRWGMRMQFCRPSWNRGIDTYFASIAGNTTDIWVYDTIKLHNLDINQTNNPNGRGCFPNWVFYERLVLWCRSDMGSVKLNVYIRTVDLFRRSSKFSLILSNGGRI